MTHKRRDRVIAEVSVSHIIRLADERGCRVNRDEVLAFLNQDGNAYEMWKQMMQAAEDFIACSLFRQPKGTQSLRGMGQAPRRQLAAVTSVHVPGLREHNRESTY